MRFLRCGRAWWALALWLAFPIVISAEEDVEILHLKSGDRYSGQSLSVEEGHLIWQTRFGENMRVPLDEIAHLETVVPLLPESDSPDEASPADAESSPGAAAAEPQPVVEPLAAEGAEETAAATAPAIEVEADSWLPPMASAVMVPIEKSYTYTKETVVDWTKRAEFGGQLNRGNSDQMTLNVGLHFEKATEKLFSSFTFGGQYGESGGENVINRWNGDGTLDFAKTRESNWILFVTSKNLFDKLRDLDYRGTLSGGFGFRFINEADRRFIVRVGPAVTWEVFKEPTSTRTTPDMFGELETAWRLTERSRVEHKTNLFPALTADDAMRLNSNHSLFVTLDEASRWQLKLTFALSHVAQPNGDRNPNDYTTTASLVYTRK